jgi:hypothetical protein
MPAADEPRTCCDLVAGYAKRGTETGSVLFSRLKPAERERNKEQPPPLVIPFSFFIFFHDFYSADCLMQQATIPEG